MLHKLLKYFATKSILQKSIIASYLALVSDSIYSLITLYICKCYDAFHYIVQNMCIRLGIDSLINVPIHLHDLLIADMVTHHQFNCLVMWRMSSRHDSGLIQLYGGDQIKLGVPCRGIRNQQNSGTYIMYTSH